jgi:hypothetical protein
VAANISFPISAVSQAGVILYEKQCYQIQNIAVNTRSHLERLDRIYSREVDATKTAALNKQLNVIGDATKYQNITVPICEPQVENAVVYQASVFLTGNPIFGVVADPVNEDAALQMQAVIEENSIRGGWVSELITFFRDCFKYNLGAVEVAWEQQTTQAVETAIDFTAGIQGKPVNVTWTGNVIRRLDLYNTFWDTRVAPQDIPTKGEFAGYIKRMSRIELLIYMDSIPSFIKENKVAALNSNAAGAGTGYSYWEPSINPEPLIQPIADAYGTNWLSWAGLPGADPNKPITSYDYEITFLYARIVPVEFKIDNVPSKDTPQIWKFTIVNHQVIISAEMQTNAHNKIPIFFGQTKTDGLKYQTKSFLANSEPFQSVATALMNSMIASRRRAISDRGLYDPSRVASEHINSDNPAAKIPVRPRAYGKPLSEAYYSIPFKDEQAGVAMQEIKAVSDFSDSLNGTNTSKQGQFRKGNRTAHEYDDIMAHSNGRDQMTSMVFEAQVFTPIKEILKINILQYQAAGDIYSASQGKTVVIDPLALRKTLLAFKVSDGILPTDKIISSDDLAAGMQAIGTNPQIGAGYNLAPMFSYLMKTRNVNLKPFEKSPEQMAYEEAVQRWQQLAELAIKAGQEFKLPQPLPAQFGYVPQGLAANKPTGQDQSQQVTPNPQPPPGAQ